MHASLLLGALLVASARGAAVLEDQSGSWEQATLGSQPAAVWLDALPQELFDKVVAETDVFHAYDEKRGGNFMHGKRPTWWFNLYEGADGKGTKLRKPRCAIEAAIRRLHDISFPGGNPRIRGGEWWMQTRAPTETIGFHYDKDEAFASQHMTMKYPEVSTVTYLTTIGAPTLILNQTTPDGNKEVPEVPVEGRLVYPHPNKHITFRGNLQHGCPGQLSMAATGEAGAGKAEAETFRRTLLVNWWLDRPMPPNCVDLQDGVLRELGLHDAEGVHELRARLGLLTPAKLNGEGPDGDSAPATALMRREPSPGKFSPMPLEEPAPGKAFGERMAMIEIPPKDNLYFQMLPEPQAGDWKIDWEAGVGSFGGNVATLDLDHQGALNALFGNAAVKVMVFCSRAQWMGLLSDVLPLSHKYSEQALFVWADPKTQSDAADAFGLSASSTFPALALHSTADDSDDKFRLQDNGGGEVTAQSMEKLLQQFLDGARDLTPFEAHDEV